MLEVKNISKSFGHLKAVDNVSFSVGKGEIVGLLGPNGAGKTTTMRILAGFLSPDRGTVTVENLDIEKNTREAQRKIGYLPENNPLYKNMQVAEFLDLAASLHQVSRNQRKKSLEFAVEAVGIEDVFYRPIGELSKGFKQRVGIAAALLHKPSLFIMDEPTEGLDPNQRSEIRQLIKNLARDRTVIISTHVMQEASAVCSRLLIINKGKIVADGTPQALEEKVHSEKGYSSLLLELEGNDIEEELQKIKEIQSLKIKKRENRRVEAQIGFSPDQPLEPLLSQKIWQNRWIVWKFNKEESNLEEIFEKLTKD